MARARAAVRVAVRRRALAAALLVRAARAGWLLQPSLLPLQMAVPSVAVVVEVEEEEEVEGGRGGGVGGA